jgi:hypothetical protein
MKPVKILFIATCLFASLSMSANERVKPDIHFTVIQEDSYDPIKTDKDISQLLALLQPYKNQSDALDKQVAFAAHYFEGRPTELHHLQGEGDLCPGSIDLHGCVHLQQDPVYRTDFFACNTLIQIILASVYAKNILEFKQLILQIEYGAAHEPSRNIHYYNRNNFISGDFNPVNQKQGFIVDATRQSVFAPFVKTTSTIIDRQSWFNHQMQDNHIENTVRVLSFQQGASMWMRAKQNYPLVFHRFAPERVSIDYIPKASLVKKIGNTSRNNQKIFYEPDEEKINQLPTPAIVEIVRDASKWTIQGKNIVEVTGSGINVSHLGLIYRQFFKKGELIYQKISCSGEKAAKACTVRPVYCALSEGCPKIMFSHATTEYPNEYVYYQDTKGFFYCSNSFPITETSPIPCNRVVSLPFGDYVASASRYSLMKVDSILGIHLEKIGSSLP